MTEREERIPEFSDEELEALAGDDLPDRAAMSTMSTDSSELAGLGVDDVGAEPADDEA